MAGVLREVRTPDPGVQERLSERTKNQQLLRDADEGTGGPGQGQAENSFESGEEKQVVE